MRFNRVRLVGPFLVVQPHGISGNWNNVHRMLNELGWWEKYLKGGAQETTVSGRR